MPVKRLSASQESVVVPAVLATAKEELGIPHLSFITVVDRVGSFEITYELMDFRGARVTLKTTIEGEEPVIGTVTGIYPTANWHERHDPDAVWLRRATRLPERSRQRADALGAPLL